MFAGRRSILAALLPAFALALALPPSAHAAGDTIFAGTQVHTINIQFAQPAFWDSLVAYYNAGNEQYMAASVTFDGATMDSVGVRLKGNASYTHANNKKPFRLSFDEYRGAQRLDGLKGIHLNNCWEDPTFMREKLHLDFLRDAGIPAPRGAFAQVYLNGELWGFYSMVEHVDKTFLSSRFGNSGGNLYKAVDGLLISVVSDFKWYGSDPASYYAHYELKTDDSLAPWTDLVNVINLVNNSASPATDMPLAINMDSVYRGLAVDNLLANLDNYSGSCRNFYVYFNAVTGKMEWVPWDAGMSFGSYFGLTTAYETLSLTYASSAVNRPLATKIFTTPALLQGYLETACELSSAYLTTDRLYAQIDAIAPVIRPYVDADPRKMTTIAQFDANLTSDITLNGHRKPGLKSFIAARIASVQSQLAALGVSCVSTVQAGDVVINELAADNTAILDPAGEAEDWVEIHNTTTGAIDLGGMYLSDSAGAPTKWQFPAGTTIAAGGYVIVWADGDVGQSGLHATWSLAATGGHVRLSNAAGAELDAVSYGAQTANLTYARIPNATGPFTITHATPGLYNGYGNFVAAGSVVVNEFQASNTVILDPAGEAEDWIELFNRTAQDVPLGGLYMSDNVANPGQWRIPDGTVIPAGGYLIVWADDDAGQPGVHAPFKLSAGGEAVILANPDLTTVDSVVFGAQTANVSYARIPNGTGSFRQVPATLGAYNFDPALSGVPSADLFALAPAVPNPFNPTTTLSFTLPAMQDVKLVVFALDGRVVRTLVSGAQAAGHHEVTWDGRDDADRAVGSGSYLCRLQSGALVDSRKITLMK